MYTPEERQQMSDAEAEPFAPEEEFTYDASLTARHFALIRALIKTMIIDPLPELQAAWTAILAAGGPEACPEAMAELYKLPFSYAEADAAAAALNPYAPGNTPLSCLVRQREWSEFFRKQYLRAVEAAGSGSGVSPLTGVWHKSAPPNGRFDRDRFRAATAGAIFELRRPSAALFCRRSLHMLSFAMEHGTSALQKSKAAPRLHSANYAGTQQGCRTPRTATPSNAMHEMQGAAKALAWHGADAKQIGNPGPLGVDTLDVPRHNGSLSINLCQIPGIGAAPRQCVPRRKDAIASTKECPTALLFPFPSPLQPSA
jgi:hypothetical protein